jgi:hypothetical protein
MSAVLVDSRDCTCCSPPERSTEEEGLGSKSLDSAQFCLLMLNTSRLVIQHCSAANGQPPQHCSSPHFSSRVYPYILALISVLVLLLSLCSAAKPSQSCQTPNPTTHSPPRGWRARKAFVDTQTESLSPICSCCRHLPVSACTLHALALHPLRLCHQPSYIITLATAHHAAGARAAGVIPFSRLRTTHRPACIDMQTNCATVTLLHLLLAPACVCLHLPVSACTCLPLPCAVLASFATPPKNALPHEPQSPPRGWRSRRWGHPAQPAADTVTSCLGTQTLSPSPYCSCN